MSAIQCISSRVQSFSDWKMHKYHQHAADRCKSNATGHRHRRKRTMFWWHWTKELTARTSAMLDCRSYNLSILLPPSTTDSVHCLLLLWIKVSYRWKQGRLVGKFCFLNVNLRYVIWEITEIEGTYFKGAGCH